MNKKFLHSVTLLVLAFVIVLPHFVLAGTTGRLTGKVVNEETGEPIPGVAVSVVGTKMGALTNEDGEYTIINVPVGTYTLRASIIGFAPVEVTNAMVSVDLATYIDFTLSRKALELGKTIVVRAERPLILKDKTTSVAKLANRLKQDGHSVMLAAADTFRAAAVEQLKTWGERAQIPVIAQQTGADAAAVAFDALQAAKARGVGVLLVDTAGRQHTHAGLMDELKKIKRVLGKLDESAPHEVLLVLDGGTGQNALSQLSHFRDAVGVTGLVITKLDGTAKGGVLVAIAKKTGLPIRYIGVGEAIDDLQEFRASEFVDALLPTDNGA